MFKFVLSAFVCLAFAMPVSAQCCPSDCGCDAPKQRLGFVDVQRSLPQISMKCTTDACGCSRRKLSIDRVCVTGAKLGMVDRKPRKPCCKGGLLKGMFKGKGCGCGAPAPCGCEAPAPEPCGCEAAPVADCGCGGGAMEMPMETYAEPTYAAPAADCGCNG